MASKPVWVPAGPVNLGFLPFVGEEAVDDGLVEWCRGLELSDPWSPPLAVTIRLADSEDLDRYRTRLESHIDFPAWRWDRAARSLQLRLPTALARSSCWTLSVAHRHGLLAGLCAASLGSNWRVVHGGMAALPDGRAVLLVGRSGAGKSTLLRRLSSELRGDEIVALRMGPRGPELRGTAVPGELRCDDLRPMPLAGVLMPGRSENGQVRLEPLPLREKVSALLSAVVRVSPEGIARDLAWLDALVGRVPCFRVHWRPGGEHPRPAVWAALEA